MAPERILVCVDDEEENLSLFVRTFRKGYRVLAATSAGEALELCRTEKVDAVLADQRMPGMAGVDLLERLAEEMPEVVRILVTGYTDVESAVNAINRGKVHRYVAKPWDPRELREVVARELEVRDLRARNLGLTRELKAKAEELRRRNLELEESNRELIELNRRLETKSRQYELICLELQDQVKQNQTLRKTMTRRCSLRDLVGRSEKMQSVFRIIRDVAKTESSVLILGETGTGKELAARAIHAESHRCRGPFVSVNCPALPADLLDSELFGHEKGAFTGAIRRKRGRFELARGGTVFLDEIGELSAQTQTRLLRVLQERCFERVGGEETISVDVRVVSATNRDLERAMREGHFREDLYYRLNVISVEMPPLREKPEDIPLLCERFLSHYGALAGKKVREISPEAMRILMEYEWPGNVRELENVVERAVALTREEVIGPDLLAPHLTRGASSVEEGTLRDLEMRHIRDVLERVGWNKHRAAHILGINRSTLYGKMRRYGIRTPSGGVDSPTRGS